MTRKNFTLVNLIIIAAFSRLIPHWPNVTAMTAMALLAGSQLKPRTLGVLVPLAALFISDIVLGFHSVVPFVYGAFVLITLFSSVALTKLKTGRLVLITLFSSLAFFFISNAGVWWVDGMYPRTTQGLTECYIAALPFLRNQIAGDLAFTGVIFAVYQVLAKNFFKEPSLKVQA